MTIESAEQLERLRTVGRIVALTLAHMGERLEPGMRTRELDALGQAFLERHGARSAPQISYGFPGATCISVNQVAAHGPPDDTVLQPGDLVNIDVSAERDGLFADTGASYIVPPARPRTRALCWAARKALREAVSQARTGAPLNAIGAAIERVARRQGFQVIRNLCGHGVGHALHEEPRYVPGFRDPAERTRLHEGLVIAIEPFVSTGPREVHDGDDGWSLLVPAPHLTAQYEHTVVVTRRGALVMTARPD